MPQLANPAAVRFARGRRHIIADKRFHGGFISADAEDVRGDFQLIQQGFVIQAVGCEAVQIDRTLRRKPDFIGEARQVILPLTVAVAYGKDRLAAIAKFAQRFPDVLHGRLIGAREVFQIHHDAGDIAIVFRLTNGVDDIKQ